MSTRTCTRRSAPKVELPKIVVPRCSTMLPDTAHYTNRFTVPSLTSEAEYIVGQHKTNHNWQCSCMSHRVRGYCKHIDRMGLDSLRTPVEAVTNVLVLVY